MAGYRQFCGKVHYGSLETEESKAAGVRNGYLPERTIQTGLGDLQSKCRKLRDRSDLGIRFNSSLILFLFETHSKY